MNIGSLYLKCITKILEVNRVGYIHVGYYFILGSIFLSILWEI